ncbi:MAG: sigma-54-dependent Fis family transcriptional regulator, partial [Gammaproteobacteria bacterium]|nr:sigma-54-dependent Fis family transcriptional regulator [Gammaproteobacteria bacterium]
VRELDNVVQRALILRAGDEVSTLDLCFENEDTGTVVTTPVTETQQTPATGRMQASASESVSSANEQGSGSLSSDLKSVEDQMILDALNSGNGSRKVAAEILGISPRTLRYKIARLRDAGVAIPR